MKPTIDRVLDDVVREFEEASARFAPFNSAHEGFAVLLEEVDELWDAVKLKQTDPERGALMRAEAVQVAAMALRFLHDMDEAAVLR